ncbi:MAG: trypsin-like peptidase domain-containing protein [Opitutales bacterium]|nr:trypsin-like peptidase domain-containing protein [Opitutales bacterium]
MKSPILFLVVLALQGFLWVTPPLAEASQRSVVVKVFSETVYNYDYPRMWPRGPLKKTVSTSGSGTAFLVDYDDRLFLVTAAHVISGPRTPDFIEAEGIRVERNQITEASFRFRVSHLAARPQKIAVDRHSDLAVIMIEREVLDALNLRPLRSSRTHDASRSVLRWGRSSRGPLSVDEQVRVWGFPGTTQPQVNPGDMRVTSVQPNYFVLNSGIEGGYSGGPVVDNDDNLVGVAARSTDRQARCAPLNALLTLLKEFDERAVNYRDGMPPLF